MSLIEKILALPIDDKLTIILLIFLIPVFFFLFCEFILPTFIYLIKHLLNCKK